MLRKRLTATTVKVLELRAVVLLYELKPGPPVAHGCRVTGTAPDTRGGLGNTGVNHHGAAQWWVRPPQGQQAVTPTQEEGGATAWTAPRDPGFLRAAGEDRASSGVPAGSRAPPLSGTATLGMYDCP